MWIVARYLPVAPFSLKPAAATSSGGKTLLAPTPYAIKMALLDVAIRTMGVSKGEQLFSSLRNLIVQIALPEDLLVFKSFSKSWRPVESKDSQKKDETREEFEARQREKLIDRIERGQYPLYSTIAYREYVYYRDAFQLAFTSPDEESLPAELPRLLTCINYFGKRGGFMQIMEPPRRQKQLPGDHFTELTAEGLQQFHPDGTMQVLDDCGKSLTFQRANIYSSERITVGKERILRHIVLPYRLLRSSRSYSWYQRIQKEE
ncbi:MAG TPA: hypothetical protein VIX20_05980 [Ktedonobacteraceae bacterium]